MSRPQKSDAEMDRRVIEILSGDSPPTGLVPLRALIGGGMTPLRESVRRLRWAGKIEMDTLKLSASVAPPAPAKVAAPVATAKAKAPKPLSERAVALLAWIEERAGAGLPCPSNGEIASRCGLMKTESGLSLLHRLEAAGAITVERFGQSRVVTIVATGATTARAPGDLKPHWREGKAAPSAPPPEYRRSTERTGEVPLSKSSPVPRGAAAPPAAAPRLPAVPAGAGATLPSPAAQVVHAAAWETIVETRDRLAGAVADPIWRPSTYRGHCGGCGTAWGSHHRGDCPSLAVAGAVRSAASIAADVAAEAGASSARRRIAGKTSNAVPIEAEGLRHDMAGFSDVERICTILVEEPGDLVRAVARRHPGLWRRVVELGRTIGKQPGLALFDVVETGLEALEEHAR